MAKQNKQCGADELIEELDGMGEKLKAAIDELVAANKEIDSGVALAIKQIEAEAALQKQPNQLKARKLNLAYMRLTGKSHLKDESDRPGSGPDSGVRKRRSSALMEELAGQVHGVIQKHKDGISGPEIRKAVDGLESGDNIALLLKKYRHKFGTEGPRKAMKYMPA